MICSCFANARALPLWASRVTSRHAYGRDLISCAPARLTAAIALA